MKNSKLPKEHNAHKNRFQDVSFIKSSPQAQKCGFEAIKRANPWAWIHPSEL
jgi:hypothetical protein